MPGAARRSQRLLLSQSTAASGPGPRTRGNPAQLPPAAARGKRRALAARRRRRNAHDPPAPRLSRRAASALANIATERASARPIGKGPRPACGLARHVAPPSPLPLPTTRPRATRRNAAGTHPPRRRRAGGFPERELAGAFAEAKAYTHAGTGAAAAVTAGTPRGLPANQQTNKPADELSIRLAS